MENTSNERLFDFAHYDTHMGFQNGAQAGLNTFLKFCVGVPIAWVIRNQDLKDTEHSSIPPLSDEE